MQLLYLFLCILLSSSIVVFGLTSPNATGDDLGITCQLPESRPTPGKCVPVRKCPYAIGNLKVGLSPITCKLEKDPYAVCCPTQKRISEQKCEGYTNILRQKITSKVKRARRKLILESATKKPRPTINQTAVASEKLDHEADITCPLFLPTRISGGRDAFKDEYPHQVALGYGPPDKVAWRCGGVLISSKFIATAGHCAATKYGAPVQVLLGDRFLSKEENPARQIVGVEKIFTHPDYKPPSLYNDLTLIKLASKVSLSRSIFPACLPQPQYRLDKKNTVTVTGFGQLGAMESTSDTLQSVDLKKFAISECSDAFMNDTATRSRLINGVLPSQFCAGDKDGSKDTCHGDSGSGAVVTTDYPCIFYVVGITSFGSSFCGMQQPGVYTNVGRYLDWIEDIVWPVSHAKTPPTTVSTSETVTKPPESVSPTTNYIPRNQRPKTTRKPVFLADMTQTIHSTTQAVKTTIEVTTIPTTTAIPATTTPEPSTKKQNHNSTPTNSTTPTIFTPFSTTPKSQEVTTLNATNRSTKNPNNVPRDSSALLSSILGYGENITRATISTSINNVTSNVSSILSIVNGI